MTVRPIDANIAMKKIREYMEDFPNASTRLATCRSILSMLGDENQIPTLTPPNEWISVEEKLPENGQVVLFYQKDGFIYCAEYFSGNALMSPGWFIDNDSWDAKEVTHWMPLPAPPDSRQPEGEV